MMKITFFKLLVIMLCLSSCDRMSFFRANGHPIAPGEFENEPDAPALIENKNARIEVRAKSFNGLIHVGLVIKAKERDVTYARQDVYIESLAEKAKYGSDELTGSYNCPQSSRSDKFYNNKLKSYVIAKDCVLKISYVFSRQTLNNLFVGDDIMDGFIFYDNGLVNEKPLVVELKPVILPKNN